MKNKKGFISRLLAVLVVLFSTTILFVGCASIAPTRASRSYWAKEFEVLTAVNKTLMGDFIHNDMLVYKHTDGWGTTNTVMVGKFYPPKENLQKMKEADYSYDCIFSIKTLYQGHRWLFIDTLFLKTDDGVFTLKDDNPKREVHTIASDVYNEEIVDFNIVDDNIIKSLMNTKNISIQYKALDIIEFSADDVKKIQSFLKQDVILKPSENW